MVTPNSLYRRTAALLQIALWIILGVHAFFSDISRTKDFQVSFSHVGLLLSITVQIFIGFVAIWKRNANYIRMSALYQLAMFIYNIGDTAYYLMTINFAEVCKATLAAEGALDTSMETLCESSLFFYFSVLFHVCFGGFLILLDLTTVITRYRYALFITDQEYNEQQHCDGALTKKTQGVSSASFTTRNFLRKRTHPSIGDNQANLSAI